MWAVAAAAAAAVRAVCPAQARKRKRNKVVKVANFLSAIVIAVVWAFLPIV